MFLHCGSATGCFAAWRRRAGSRTGSHPLSCCCASRMSEPRGPPMSCSHWRVGARTVASPAALPSVPLPQRACCVCACHQPALSASDRTPASAASVHVLRVSQTSVCLTQPACTCSSLGVALHRDHSFPSACVCYKRACDWLLLAALHPDSPAPVQLRHACTPKSTAARSSGSACPGQPSEQRAVLMLAAPRRVYGPNHWVSLHAP